MLRLVRSWKSGIAQVLAVGGIAGSLMLLEGCVSRGAALSPSGPGLSVPAGAAGAAGALVGPGVRSGSAAFASSQLADPRYRPPLGLAELEQVASAVGITTGSAIHGRIVTGPETGPLCGIRGSMEDGIIRVHPRAATQIPPNSWAFIFGHEFAHQTQHLAQHGATTPELELRADLVGADYARKAGFDLIAHLGWILSCRDHYSASNGYWHGRAQATAQHFGINPVDIQLQTERYRHIQFLARHPRDAPHS